MNLNFKHTTPPMAMTVARNFVVNYLELINSETILKEKIIPYGKATIGRYFQKGLFFTHDRKDNVERLTYRGSALVRAEVLSSFKRGRTVPSIGTIADAIDSVSGPEDDILILDALKKDIEIKEIVTLVLEKIREKKIISVN